MKKKTYTSKIISIFTITAAITLFGSSLKAATPTVYRFGGSAFISSGKALGAIAHVTNYSSSTAAYVAVQAKARQAAQGYPANPNIRTWYQKGWSATARGYNQSYSFTRCSWSYAYGWGTANAAVNTALNGLGGSFNIARGYLCGYNN